MPGRASEHGDEARADRPGTRPHSRRLLSPGQVLSPTNGAPTQHKKGEIGNTVRRGAFAYRSTEKGQRPFAHRPASMLATATATTTETLGLGNCQTYKGDATLTKPPCAAPRAMAVAKRGISRQLMPDAGGSKRWGAGSDWRRTGERKRSAVSMWAVRVEGTWQSGTTHATTKGCAYFRAVGANADRAVWCTITVVIERQSVDFVCSVGD